MLSTLTEEQNTAVYAIVGQAVLHGNDNSENDEDEEETTMKHNLFDPDTQQQEENVISHDDMQTIIADAKRYGSLKDSFLAHSTETEYATQYGT